jgi:hypothetical protein
MTATDERNLSDCPAPNFETRDILQQRELADRNLTKLPGRGLLARCWTWTTSGEERE